MAGLASAKGTALTAAQTTSESAPPVGGAPVRVGDATLTIADEVEHYTRGIPGAHVEAVRTGRGFGPSIVYSVGGDGYVAASGSAGFPVLGRTTFGDEQIFIASIASAPPGSRWCEIDLVPGMVLAYGPGAEHHAVTPAGLRFSYAGTNLEQLRRSAAELGFAFTAPPRGEVQALEPSVQTNALAYALSAIVEASVAGIAPQENRENDVLASIVRALAHETRTHRVGARRKIDSRHICNIAIEYVQSVGRLLSIRELCLVTYVSERRLRDAFNAVYDVAPNRFFRLWALDEARRRLMAGDQVAPSVTMVALELGFSHLGRFAGHYAESFGESPSATLGRTG